MVPSVNVFIGIHSYTHTLYIPLLSVVEWQSLAHIHVTIKYCVYTVRV